LSYPHNWTGHFQRPPDALIAKRKVPCPVMPVFPGLSVPSPCRSHILALPVLSTHLWLGFPLLRVVVSHTAVGRHRTGARTITGYPLSEILDSVSRAWLPAHAATAV